MAETKAVENMSKEELLALVQKTGKGKRASETTLLAKYPHLQAGTVAYDPIANKQFGIIKCTVCSAERKTWTSDLFQINKCDTCREAARKQNKVAQRQAERDALKRLNAMVEAQALAPVETVG
ncbi:MAG: hypothetical protein Q8K86_09635 [Candidatus Nanopelagicaceae bacterium]|nr:hypothetical protein [Candidatus Nanopelagicaceae bacterium]